VNSSGVLGGLFAGYNWQTGSNIVLGVEGDIEATSLSAKATSFTALPANNAIPAGNATQTDSIPWQGSVRGRLGYAANNALFYITGGLAFGQINTKYTTLPTNTFSLIAGSTSFSGTQAGWTVGGGVEYAFTANWIGRAEYRYTSFGGFKDNIVSAANGAWNGNSAKHQVSENAIRVGIAYKFGAPASAVVAKY
jgi:outer membrane immunogenic protein